MRQRIEGIDAKRGDNTGAIMDFLERQQAEIKTHRLPQQTVEKRFTEEELATHRKRLADARQNRESNWAIEASAEGADAETMFPFIAEALLTDPERVLVYATKTHPYDDEINHVDTVLAFCSVSDPDCDSWRVAVDVTSARNPHVLEDKLERDRNLARSGKLTELLYGPVPNLKNLPLLTIFLTREQLGEFATVDALTLNTQERLKELRGSIVGQMTEELTEQLLLIEQAQDAGRMSDSDARQGSENILGALEGLGVK